MSGWDSDEELKRDFQRLSASGSSKRNNQYFSKRNSSSNSQTRYDQRKSKNFNSSRNNYHTAPEESIEMLVHSKDCGRIIGKGGSKIRELQEDSGARIKVSRNDGNSSKVPVLISGSVEAVAKAKALVEEVIDEAKMYRRPSPPPESNDTAEKNGKDEKYLVEGFIDWGMVIADADKEKAEYWAKFPKVVKDLYIESDQVADMTKAEVDKWRKENFDLAVVDLSPLKREPLNPTTTFQQAFSHYPEILTEMDKQGFEKPTPIQCQVWPMALRGFDVIGIAQTGTGKTLAFLLPAFIHIDNQITPRSKRMGPSALVLTPTRELALQIEKEVNKYSYRGIRCVCVYGGGNRKKQVEMVMSGVELIVATPGRFNDLLSCEIITLESVTFLVLDEADRMLDMGFEPQIMKILLDVRPDRQTLMTSATWPFDVRRLAKSYMCDPFQVNVGSLDLAATHTVQQLIEVIPEEDKKSRLYEFLSKLEDDEKILVFVGTKATCDYISGDLSYQGVLCESIHGGREQEDREQSLEDFKTGQVRILIATDVASRGLDVKDITHVFNYDFPRNIEEYVHRVGRTGRAGRTGVSISLVTRGNWASAKELINILEEAEQEVPMELYEMAERYEEMKKRRGPNFRGGGRRYGGGGGGRGFHGGRGRGFRCGGGFDMF